MRCNFVDLYYALYGSKRPLCLSGADKSIISGLPKIPKIPKIAPLADIKRRSESPFEQKPETISEHISRESSHLFKQEPELIVADEHIAMNVTEEQSQRIKVFTIHQLITFFFPSKT